MASLFASRTSPERDRWDDAAAALGLTTSHRRSSRSMDGELFGLYVEILEVADSPLMLFVEYDAGDEVLPVFNIEVRANYLGDSQLRPVHTGDLTFEHQFATLGRKQNRVLAYLDLERRDVLLQLYRQVIIKTVTQDSLRATLELDDWEAVELVDLAIPAARTIARFYRTAGNALAA